MDTKSITYISITTVLDVAYLSYTIFIWGFTQSYPSSSTGLFYYLLIFVPLIIFFTHKGYIKIKNNKNIGWLYCVFPIFSVTLASLLSFAYSRL
jgi:hypothetical protein